MTVSALSDVVTKDGQVVVNATGLGESAVDPTHGRVKTSQRRIGRERRANSRSNCPCQSAKSQNLHHGCNFDDVSADPIDLCHPQTQFRRTSNLRRMLRGESGI